MENRSELLKSELKTYSFENFGQLLKVSASLTPEAFPYKVLLPADSDFFRSMYQRLLLGVGGNLGNFIERSGVVGVNDLGRVMLSAQIFDGDNHKSLTDKTKPSFLKHLSQLRAVGLPPGWRTFGFAHSHPMYDIDNQSELMFRNGVPRTEGIPISWSNGDFQNLILRAENGYDSFTTSIMINSTQINFMIVTKETIQNAKNPDPYLKQALTTHRTKGVPPYNLFQKLGVVLYAGNHFGRTKGEIRLERLT